MVIAAGREPGGQARRVLVVGGGISGLAVVRELRRRFRVAVVDPKEYFEFTPGILRAFADPAQWDALTFLYHEVLEKNFGVRWIWGEVTKIDSEECCAYVKTIFAREPDTISYDFCVVAGGCHFSSFTLTGESLWSAIVHASIQNQSALQHLDERYLEGRRRRVLEEHQLLQGLNQKRGNVLIVGAGYTGVEFVCELQHFLPGLCLTLCDCRLRCLGRLPQEAAEYCEAYMRSVGIRTFYGYDLKYDPNNSKFWAKVGLPKGVDHTYMLSGVKSSSSFMPKEILSDRGPEGGGWIMTNRCLQVVDQRGERWGRGLVFAAGDCVSSCVGNLPKTCYPAEHQALIVSRNIKALDRRWYGSGGCLPMRVLRGASRLRATWYPWGAGIYAISLGPNNGCVVFGAADERGSGRLYLRGLPAVVLKELILSTKVAQCRGSHALSHWIWCLVHHWPVNLWGRGPLVSC